MKIILIGAPGSGKGTQADFLAKHFAISKISTGDILRAAVLAGTHLGKQVHAIMEQGGLVSDDIIISVVKERLAEDDCKHGFILDGFPRTLEQAEALKMQACKVGYVINIHVPASLIVARITGRRLHEKSGRVYHIKENPPQVSDIDDITGEHLVQRKDDKEETVKVRLAAYEREVSAMIDFYNNEPDINYLKIDGVGSVGDVSNRILKSIKEVAM